MSNQLLHFAAVVLFVAAPHTVAEEPGPTSGSESLHLGFLQQDRDYIIKFPETHTFRSQQSGVLEMKTSQDGKLYASNWRLNLAPEVFTVKQFAQGSWVLVEHPAKPGYALAWDLKRIAMAQLTDRRIRELESTEEGNETLAQFRELAQAKIETAESWVNLDHAIAISAVPDTLPAPQWSVTTAVSSTE
jgi:hypothetical protein